MDDNYRLRLRRAGFLAPDPGRSAGGRAAFVGKVVSTGANLGVGKFALVNPVDVTGPEAEGGPATLTVVDAAWTVPVLQLGPAAPATGDYQLCRSVPYRWVADKQASGGGPPPTVAIPGCFCTSAPAALHMTSSDEAANLGMFRSGTISYQPVPAAYAGLHLRPSEFLGDQMWPDAAQGGALFRYLLTCSSNLFTLTRIYPNSPLSDGGAYRDGILYQWVIGAIETQCSPFMLHTGQAYPGSDPVTVMIDA